MTATPLPERGRQGLVDGAPGSPDPAYRQAVIDLLGLLAYGELSAFQRLAENSRAAPTIADEAALGRLAAIEFGHFSRLHERLLLLGVEPAVAMAPYKSALDGFHERTAPADWFEGLTKAYVGDGIGVDFYRAMASYLDPATREVVVEALSDAGRADFIVDRLRACIAADPPLGGRLALWGRRLLGEALAQAHRVAAERDSLGLLLPVDDDGSNGSDSSDGFGRIVSQLTEAHTKRMAALGLSA